AKQAATLTDNLKGDLERLGGALDTALIQGGSGANDTLRTLVQTGESLIEVISAIPGPVLTGAAAFGALALLGPKVGALARTITGPLTTSVTGFSTRLAAARNAIVPFGPQLQNAGQQSLTAAQRIRTVGTAMGGLKGAASGAMGLLGGPWGVALLAATAGITTWAQGQANARAAADALSATIDEQTGKFTDSSRATVVESLLGDLSPEDQQLVQRLGVDFNALADAALKGGPAYEQQRQKLVDLMDAHQGITSAFSDESMATEGLLRSFERAGDAAEATRIKQEILTKARQDQAIADSNGAASANAAERAITAVGDATQETAAKAQAAQDPAAGITRLLADLGAKSEETKAQLDALSTALDLLGGGTRAAQAAQDAQAASFDKVAEAADRVREATEKKTGKDYTSAEKTRDVAAANREYRSALRDVATQTLDRIKVQQGENVSVKALNDTYNAGRAVIEGQLRLRGVHADKLQAEIDKIIGTKANFQRLLDEYKKTPGQVATTVKTPGLPESKKGIQGYWTVINGVPTFKETKVSAPGATTAKGQLHDVRDAANSVPGSVVVSISLAGVRAVQAQAARVRGEIASLRSANGNIVRAYAGGGMDVPNGHVAEIATAGTRIWAEPETQGEAYIPLADDWRRPRAKAILAETAKRLGGNVQWFAGGGAIGMPGLKPGAFAAGGLNAPLGAYYSQYIQSLGEEVTAAILGELRAGVRKAISDQDTRVKAAGTRRANSTTTLRADQRAIAAAKRDVARAKSRTQREAAQKKLRAAQDKYDKDRRNAAQATIKEDKAIAAGKNAIAAAQAKVAAAEKRQKVQSQSELTKFGTATATGVKNAGAFIKNLEKLASRGYVTLAQQLAQMSNEDAEKIAAQAAGASKATLDVIARNVNTSITQTAQLDNMQGITTLFGAVGRGNFSLSEIAAQSGMSLDELIEAAKLIAGDLKGNKNAAKILADLAELAKNGALGVGWFESGGYTGNGGVKTPAGIVHGKEFVFDAPAVSSIGVANLEAMRRARMIPAASVQGAAFAGRSTLVGLVIEGTMQTPFGPTEMRGVVRQEIAADKAASRQAARQRTGVSV
ncbi:MAG TPA: hypothetical protein VGF17_24435, partial [Phytomonospora sp.]